MRISLADTAVLFEDGDWVESKDQDRGGQVRLIQLADIGIGVFIDKSSRFLTAETAERLRCTYLNPGDILIARMPDPIGRACIFPDLGRPCVTAVDVAILRPRKEVDREYLMHLINSPSFRREVLSQAKGATRQRISRKNLGSIVVEVPSLDEQQRVVARIKECLEHVDEIEYLRREAIAEATGLLPSMLNETFVELASNYESAEIGEVSAETRYGTSQKCASTPSGVAILRIPNVAGGFVNFGGLKYCELETDEFRRLCLREGDLLFVRTNGSRDLVGRCAIFEGDGEDTQYAFASYLIRVRLDRARMHPHYLAFFLNSTHGRAEIDQRRRTSAGQFNINSENLRSISVPLPPVKVQNEVVRALSTRQGSVIELQRELAATKDEASHLREAILRKAFAGEL
jgi:type I restriction enzyme S subunit